MKTFLKVLALLLLCSSLARAQQATSASLTAAGTSANCAPQNGSVSSAVFRQVGTSGTTTITVTGTWSGTISFYLSGDNATSWVAPPSSQPTSVTANGTSQISVSGFSNVCAVFTTATSGTAVVTIRTSPPAVGLLGGGGSSPAGSGAYPQPVYINDVFNRNTNLGANWTNYVNSINPNNSAAKATVSAQANVAAYTGTTTVATQSVKVVILGLNGTTDILGAAVRISGTINTSVSYYACSENSATLFLTKNTGVSSANGGGTSTSLAQTTITGAAGDVLWLSVVGNTLTCSRNGQAQNLQANDASSPLTTGFPGIAYGGSNTVTATMDSFQIINPIPVANTNVNLLFDGDSITMGATPAWEDAFPNYLFFPGKGLKVFSIENVGEGGKCLGIGCAALNSGTIETLISTGTSIVDTMYVTGATNICVILAGTNDLFNSQTPAQTYTSLTTYIANRHTAGWKVVVIPALSRAGVDPQIQIYNQLIAANSAGADAVVTLPQSLVGVGQSANTVFYNSDKIHPTQDAYMGVMAPALVQTLNQFF